MLITPKDHIIGVFVKNLIPGKVKPEIERETNSQYALQVYEQLLTHCKNTIDRISQVDKAVFYYTFLEEGDLWGRNFQRYKQIGRTIGERIENCFELMHEKGYAKKILVRADCPGLHAELLLDVLKWLEQVDVVLGPEVDKGFYLVATTQMHEPLLAHNLWCEPEFILDLLNTLKQAGISYHVLPPLKSINTLADWHAWKHQFETPEL